MSRISSPLILALDVGTSSVRALIYDTNGEYIAGKEATIHYQMHFTPSGGAEIDANRLVSLVSTSIDKLFALAGEQAKEIVAVACTTFWHSILAIDAQAHPLTPLISWNDTRSAPAAQWLREQSDEQTLHQRTGCRIHASYWPAKITWLRNTQTCKETPRYWLSFADYLYLRLFGELKTSISLASGTGLFHQQQCQWDETTLALLSLTPKQLPPLTDFDTPMQGLRPEFASRWSTLAQIPWYLALGDGACSNIGNGCSTPTHFALMIGTSGALRAVCPTPTNNTEIPPPLWCYRLDRTHMLMGGALSDGGSLFAWLQETLKLPMDEQLERELKALSPAAHGLTLLPLLSGERSPGWRDNARGAIMGLNRATTSTEILRAGLEAVAYQFSLIYQPLKALLGTPTQIISTGGGLHNSQIWNQIIADVLGAPLHLSTVAEASSRGAALMVLAAMNPTKNQLLTVTKSDEVIMPVVENYAIYEKACLRQQKLYNLLVEFSPA